MKPTQEQVIAWAREICGPNMAEWRDGTEMEWHEFHALALRCYEAGRREEREACAAVCDKLGDEYADANPADCAFAIRERGAP